jgi:hypothetical protein
MSRDDIQKLLGGYATGTLTPEEQQALFEAALTDQELFDALAREEPLREVLSDPAARAHLLAAIDDAPAPWYREWWRPILVMAAAVSIVVGVAVWDRSPAPKPPATAKVELPRFQPPVEPHNTPLLPAPPVLKPAARAFKPLPLPATKPVPPPAPAAAHVDAVQAPRNAFTIDGQLSEPRQQSQTQAQLGPAVGNGFFQQNNAPLRGTVTDSAGTAIPAASVAVKSLATGETVNTSTDAKGEFAAPEVRGNAYEISASKPGFRSVTVSEATPLSGVPAPVKLKMDPGANSQTVEVTASASTVPADGDKLATGALATLPMTGAAGVGGGGGRGGRGVAAPARMSAKAAPSPRPLLEFHLLRGIAGGEAVEVPANGTVPAGATLTLRITPAADGYLRIVPGTGSPILSPQVRRGVAFETPLPAFEQPGRVELRVYFSLQATESKQQATPSLTIGFNVQ